MEMKEVLLAYLDNDEDPESLLETLKDLKNIRKIVNNRLMKVDKD